MSVNNSEMCMGVAEPELNFKTMSFLIHRHHCRFYGDHDNDSIVVIPGYRRKYIII